MSGNKTSKSVVSPKSCPSRVDRSWLTQSPHTITRSRRTITWINITTCDMFGLSEPGVVYTSIDVTEVVQTFWHTLFQLCRETLPPSKLGTTPNIGSTLSVTSEVYGPFSYQGTTLRRDHYPTVSKTLTTTTKKLVILIDER